MPLVLKNMFNKIHSKLINFFEGDEGQIIINDHQFEIWKTQFGMKSKYKNIAFDEINTILAEQCFPFKISLFFYGKNNKSLGHINEDMEGWKDFISIIPSKFIGFNFETFEKIEHTHEQSIEVWSNKH